MRNEFEFTVKGRQIKVTNSWFRGAKLYIDGELRDFDNSIFANGLKALMSANLGEHGVLEINPVSTAFTVEVDAFLVSNKFKQHVFSSYKRLNLSEQRTAQ